VSGREDLNPKKKKRSWRKSAKKRKWVSENKEEEDRGCPLTGYAKGERILKQVAKD